MASGARIVSRERAERVWDKLAVGDFAPAQLRPVEVGWATFRALYLPRVESFVPDVYLNTGLSFFAWPRLAAYRYRFVLTPTDGFAGDGRWELRRLDLAHWLLWANHMDHVVTLSTFKSGASNPFFLHAQSFPLKQGDAYLTSLHNPKTEVLVPRKRMPRFERLQIERLVGYALPGLRILSDDSEEARWQAASKLYELALTYDQFKAFNIVIVPMEHATSAFFFPRRRTGRAIADPESRWQIAALEVNGLMQTKSERDAADLDETRIRRIFADVALSEPEFESFLELVDTF